MSGFQDLKTKSQPVAQSKATSPRDRESQIEEQLALLTQSEKRHQKLIQEIQSELKDGGVAGLKHLTRWITGTSKSLNEQLTAEQKQLKELQSFRGRLEHTVSSSRKKGMAPDVEALRTQTREMLKRHAGEGIKVAESNIHRADVASTVVTSVDKGLESGATLIGSRLFTPVGGAALGTFYGTIRHGTEALIATATGEKSWEEAWQIAKSRIAESAQSAVILAAGTGVAMGTGRALMARVAPTVIGRAAVGTAGALSASAVSTPAQLALQFYQANSDFHDSLRKEGGNISATERQSKWEAFKNARGLDSQTLLQSGAVDFLTTAVSGFIGGGSGALRDQTKAVVKQAVLLSMEGGGDIVAGVAGAAAKSGLNGQALTAKAIAEQITSSLISTAQGELAAKPRGVAADDRRVVLAQRESSPPTELHHPGIVSLNRSSLPESVKLELSKVGGVTSDKQRDITAKLISGSETRFNQQRADRALRAVKQMLDFDDKELREVVAERAAERGVQLTKGQKASIYNSSGSVCEGTTPSYGGPTAREYAIEKSYRSAGLWHPDVFIDDMLNTSGPLLGPIERRHREIANSRPVFDHTKQEDILLKSAPRIFKRVVNDNRDVQDKVLPINATRAHTLKSTPSDEVNFLNSLSGRLTLSNEISHVEKKLAQIGIHETIIGESPQFRQVRKEVQLEMLNDVRVEVEQRILALGHRSFERHKLAFDKSPEVAERLLDIRALASEARDPATALWKLRNAVSHYEDLFLALKSLSNPDRLPKEIPRAIACDLNGTLEQGGVIPESIRESLQMLTRAGVPVAIVSGLRAEKIGRLLDANGLSAKDFHIVSDGGLTYTPAGSDTPRIRLGKGGAEPKLSEIESTVKRVLVSRGLESLYQEGFSIAADDSRIMLRTAGDEGTQRFPEEVISSLNRELRRVGYRAIGASGGRYVEILPRGKNKGSGLEHFYRESGLTDAEVVKLGNEPLLNDRSLLLRGTKERPLAIAVQSPKDSEEILRGYRSILSVLGDGERGYIPFFASEKLLILQQQRQGKFFYSDRTVEEDSIWLKPERRERMFEEFVKRVHDTVRPQMANEMEPGVPGKHIFVMNGQFETHANGDGVEFRRALNASQQSELLAKVIDQSPKYSPRWSELVKGSDFELSRLDERTRERFVRFFPEVNQSDRVSITPEVRAWFMLDYLTGREGKIRREGPSYRSEVFNGKGEQFERETVTKFAELIRLNKPIPVFMLSFAPKFPTFDSSGEQMLPDISNYLAFTNLHRIAEGSRGIYQAGVEFHVGYEGGLFADIVDYSRIEAQTVLNVLKDINLTTANRIHGVGADNPVKIHDAREGLVKAIGSDEALQLRANLGQEEVLKRMREAEIVLRFLGKPGEELFNFSSEPAREFGVKLTPQQKLQRTVSHLQDIAGRIEQGELVDLSGRRSQEQLVQELEEAINYQQWVAKFASRINGQMFYSSASPMETIRARTLSDLDRLDIATRWFVEESLPQDLDNRAARYMAIDSLKYKAGKDSLGVLSLFDNPQEVTRATVGALKPEDPVRLAFQLIPGWDHFPHHGLTVRINEKNGYRWKQMTNKEIIDSGGIFVPRQAEGALEPLYFEKLEGVKVGFDHRNEIEKWRVTDESGKSYLYYRTNSQEGAELLSKRIDKLRKSESDSLIFAKIHGPLTTAVPFGEATSQHFIDEVVKVEYLVMEPVKETEPSAAGRKK